MPPQLFSLSGGPSLVLDKPIVLFGRDLECDVRFDSRKISRLHCCVAQVGKVLVVRDLGSTNGVRINGVRVSEGKLKPGDEFTIGNHRYQVRWDGPAAPAAMAPQAVAPILEEDATSLLEEEPADAADWQEPASRRQAYEAEAPLPMPDELRLDSPTGESPPPR